MNENNSKLILYQAEDGKTRIEVRLQDETAWLAQAGMGGSEEQATCKEFLQVQKEGNRRVLNNVKFSIKALAFLTNIIYTSISIPAAPLLKGTRNPVGFCFLGGFTI